MLTQSWREILSPYELAVQELVVKFEHIAKEYQIRGEYCPIELVKGRVKTISSILEKAKKKGVPEDQIVDRLEDIAGIRIICQFVEDIYTVVNLIRKRTDMQVVEELDYIKQAKPSGYRSFHLVIHYTVQTTWGVKELPVEIQIRTLAMNFWATIEHSLQYKYDQNVPYPIRERLSASAEAVLNLDNEMAAIREEIQEAQMSFQQKATVVAQILNNINNLYRVADKQMILNLQEEFFRIYNESDMDELKRFNDYLDHIAETYMAQSIQ